MRSYVCYDGGLARVGWGGRRGRRGYFLFLFISFDDGVSFFYKATSHKRSGTISPSPGAFVPAPGPVHTRCLVRRRARGRHTRRGCLRVPPAADTHRKLFVKALSLSLSLSPLKGEQSREEDTSYVLTLHRTVTLSGSRHCQPLRLAGIGVVRV